MSYGSSFLQGTKGGTYAAGWRIGTSGVVDGGTIVKAGNKASDSPITNSVGVSELADNLGERNIGSKVLAHAGSGAATTDRAGVMEARGNGVGTIAFTPDPSDRTASAPQFVMRGVSTTLNGSANTTILSRGTVGDGRYGNLHSTITDRKIGSKADEAFDIMARPSTQIVPGRTKGTGAGAANLYENPADGSVAVVSEIFPSRSVPGELTYHFGAQGKPTTDEYKAKDTHES